MNATFCALALLLKNISTVTHEVFVITNITILCEVHRGIINVIRRLICQYHKMIKTYRNSGILA